MYQYILFDLDGTITDSSKGITKCVQYALDKVGIREEKLENLLPFIGPPLRDSFSKYYGFTDQEAEKAVENYRERYQDKGIYENLLYEGIVELLDQLKQSGKL